MQLQKECLKERNFNPFLTSMCIVEVPCLKSIFKKKTGGVLFFHEQPSFLSHLQDLSIQEMQEMDLFGCLRTFGSKVGKWVVTPIYTIYN